MVFLTAAARRDRKRGLKCTLKIAEVRALMAAPCEYCGLSVSNGIDRMDPLKEYSLENCAPCCAHCNLIKNGMPLQAWNMIKESVRAARAAGAFDAWILPNFREVAIRTGQS